MDAPVEELGAPAEPLGSSGAPDLGSATVPVSPGERGRNGAAAGPTFLLARRGAGLTVGPKPLPRLAFLAEHWAGGGDCDDCVYSGCSSRVHLRDLPRAG
jgi:hypothetical protein